MRKSTLAKQEDQLLSSLLFHKKFRLSFIFALNAHFLELSFKGEVLLKRLKKKIVATEISKDTTSERFFSLSISSYLL